MDASTFLLHLLIILVAARLLGELAAACGVPSVIGELCAGILIGPSLLGWVEINEIIRLLGEIGVILLLFEVGLETDIDKLLNAGYKSIIVAIGGFVTPFIFGFLISDQIFDQPVIVSLFVGGTLTATSIGITVRTLSDLKAQHSTEGQITLGAAVLDDVLGVILLAVLYEFSTTGTVSVTNAGIIMLYVGLFFLLAPILAKVISHGIQYLDQHIDNPGLIPTTIVSLVLLFAWLAHLFGAPELLGGFAAGIALSRRFFLPFGISLKGQNGFSERVLSEMKPIVQLFTPIFFVSVGLSLDLSIVDWQSSFFWSFTITMAIVAVASKFSGALFINEPYPKRVVIGMAMVPRGEVGLIFAGLGSAANVFTNDVYTALIMVIAYTTIFSPFWIKLFYRRYGL